MVLTVTLNPLLEKKLFFSDPVTNNNRAYKQELLSGGKGINVSRQLNLLGIKNHAMTFLGGPNGKKIRSLLEHEKISFSAVNTKSESREATLILDEVQSKLTTYFGTNSNISGEEIDSFLNKLKKTIINSSIVVFSGSVPCEGTSVILEKGIELCHKYDKISILDTYGGFLENIIGLGPTVIHNNLSEINTYLKQKTDTEDEIENVLDFLYDNNVKLSFITSGKSDTFAAKSDFHYKISNPKIIEKNPTGSGDAFVAGIVYGLEKSLVFSDFIKLASSLGAQNASRWDACNVNFEDAKKLTSEVKIVEIGKKIKLIDDSPTI